MLSSLTKKNIKSSKKKENDRLYPSYVGDLPVKIIQDIIDSFGIAGDWTELAGRTGITERQVRLLKTKHKENEAEIARIVFDQWLCRVPKPRDLAMLLIYVKRYKDAETLQKFIPPQEWAEIEKRIRRVRGVTASQSTLTDPIMGTTYSESNVQRRITSEEESAVSRNMSRSSPLRSQPQSDRSTTLMSRSRQSGLNPLSVSDQTTHIESEILSQGPHVPIHSHSVRSFSPILESDLRDILSRSLEFEMIDADFTQNDRALQETHPNIYRYTILRQDWIIKDFSRKDRRFFVNELTALSVLRHTNIIPLGGYCRYNPEMDIVQHLVYPYMENRDLEWFMRSDSPSVRDIHARLDILSAIGNALSYIHHHRYVHGDLKMKNILIDRYGRPYLCDFESAVRIEELENFDRVRREQRIVGTRPFCPTRGNISRYERDIYAFGIVLAYVFAMRTPAESHYDLDGERLIHDLFGSMVNDHEGLLPRIRSLCTECVQCIDEDGYDRNDFEMMSFKNLDACAIIKIINKLEEINAHNSIGFWNGYVSKGSNDPEDDENDESDDDEIEPDTFPTV